MPYFKTKNSIGGKNVYCFITGQCMFNAYAGAEQINTCNIVYLTV